VIIGQNKVHLKTVVLKQVIIGQNKVHLKTVVLK